MPAKAAKQTDLLSPRQVARALGVSESSVKRWADQGAVPIKKTPGGHRKLAVADVIRFVRKQGYEIEKPELLGLPAHRGTTFRSGVVRKEVLAAMLAGDGGSLSALVTHAYTAGAALPDAFDDVLAPALHAVGCRWQRGETQIYEEHRGIELVHRALHDLRGAIAVPKKSSPSAICVTPEGDPYTVALAMVELVLQDAGWRVSNLGPNHPADTVLAALGSLKPKLVCVSVSAPQSPEAFAAAWRPVSELARSRGALVIGGAAVTSELRRRVRCTAFCATTRELSDLVASLR